jgi:dihydrofolate synthase / folylpolyglutamate synthase
MPAADDFLARFAALHPKKIDLTLGRTERLLEKLGNPHHRMPGVVHVAGTNGKGSTLAFLRAMLEASGAKVHVFTSPHLVRFNERIRLAGQLITDAELETACDRIEQVNAGDSITFFEITTALAFDLFARTPADFTLIEVGLGGRFDSTNVIPAPDVAVITPVSLDHREFLGDTVETIAGEKAGIIKPGSRVVIAEQGEASSRVLERAARKVRVVPLMGGQDFHAHEEGGRLVYQAEDLLLDLPLPRLMGRHQLTNAATAITALRQLAPERATNTAISEGLQRVEWPARFQRLTGRLAQRVPPGAELWLDGAHNADGARVLAESLVEIEEKSPRPLVLIAATMARKDVGEILTPFVGLAQELLAVPLAHEGSRPPAEMAQAARNLGIPAAEAGTLEETLAFLTARSWAKPPRLLIIGSLYLAGEVLQADGSLPK